MKGLSNKPNRGVRSVQIIASKKGPTDHGPYLAYFLRNCLPYKKYADRQTGYLEIFFIMNTCLGIFDKSFVIPLCPSLSTTPLSSYPSLPPFSPYSITIYPTCGCHSLSDSGKGILMRCHVFFFTERIYILIIW